MFLKPRSYKGVWRYLNEDGHEHISLMPFLLIIGNACWGLGAEQKKYTLPMDKKHKLSYNPPKEVVVAFRVEDGLLTSFEARTGGLLSPFGDAS